MMLDILLDGGIMESIKIAAKHPDTYNMIIIIVGILVPLIVLGIVIFISNKKAKLKARLITGKPIMMVGYQVETDDENFDRDVDELFDKYKERRPTIENRKEAFSSISFKTKLGEGKWRYSIGTIVNDFNQVPDDLVQIEIPAGLYVYTHFRADDTATWRKARARAEAYILNKWLPSSNYELDEDAVAYEMEYHDKRDAANTRTIILYFAIKQKGSDTSLD